MKNEQWEEEFEKVLFDWEHDPDNEASLIPPIKALISSLLSKERAEIVEGLEGMQKVFPEFESDTYDAAYSKALTDAQSLIEKRGQLLDNK